MGKHSLTISSLPFGSIRTSVRSWRCFCLGLILFFSAGLVNAQCTLFCHGNISTSLDENGEVVVPVSALLNSSDCDPGNFIVSIIWNGEDIGNTLNCEHIGFSVEAKVIETTSGSFCSTNIEVSDYTAPQIFCTDTLVPCNSNATPLEAGYPIATDNCTSFSNNDFTYTDTYIELPCTTPYNGHTVTAKIERKWWVTDASGLADTCIQNIYLKRALLTDIVFPENFDNVIQTALNCDQDASDTNVTGVPTIFGEGVVNNDVCELTVTYSDLQVPNCGPNTYNIIRTWTAADWCTGAILTHPQIIKVTDTTAPIINCPADQVLNASPISCGTTVLLPVGIATDNCSGATLSASWEYGVGAGPFYDVPVGEHIVTYTAEDACGNTSTCTITVKVLDNIAPVNICKTELAINISSGGSATVPAITFDDGSFDNCQIDYYEAKRSGMPFGAFVTFDCDDVNNGSVEVTFRIYDMVGNYNDCVASVTVHDNIQPVISCAPTVALSCGDDINNTSITGLPVAVDNCGVDSLFYTDDNSNLSSCGTGIIYRTWTVIDVSGYSSSCVQNLIVEDNTPVLVSFPADFNSSECGVSLLDPSVTGEPVVINDDCESVGVTFTENVFNIAAPACYTILRNWVVVDWCTYAPNSGSLDGYYTHTQVITVTDNDAPELIVPGALTVASLANDCGTDYININSAIAEDCNPNVTITNNSAYALNGGADASGQYPIGVHTITFTANDNCGNVSSETMVLTVEDGLAPTVACLSGLALSLNASGQVSLSPELVSVVAYDNCSDVANLTMTVYPSSFDCMDVGAQIVTLTVVDESGNEAICTTLVEIQDNQFACGEQFSLSGQVLSWKGDVMEGTGVQVINGDTNTVYTDGSGNFIYEEAMTDNGYLVKPYKNNNFSNGVSSFDLVLISKHILGTQKLNSPYKIIAADANHSGGVSTFDLVHLKKIILNIDTVLSQNTSWRFVDANFIFPNAENPFSSVFPEATFLETVSADVAGLDYTGIKIGDVTGNASPNGLLNSEGRDELSDLTFEMEEQAFYEDEIVEVVFKAKTPKDLQSYQFTITLDTNMLELVEIIPGTDLKESKVGMDDFGLRLLEKGVISTQWINSYDEVLPEETEFFRLRCTAKSAAMLSEAVMIYSGLTSAEAYRGDSNGVIEELNIKNYFSKEEEVEDFTSLSMQNAPNPFKSHTVLTIEMPLASQVEISIYDQTGRVAKQISKHLETGSQELTLDRKGMPMAGIYFCKLTIVETEERVTKRLVVID